MNQPKHLQNLLSDVEDLRRTVHSIFTSFSESDDLTNEKYTTRKVTKRVNESTNLIETMKKNIEIFSQVKKKPIKNKETTKKEKQSKQKREMIVLGREALDTLNEDLSKYFPFLHSKRQVQPRIPNETILLNTDLSQYYPNNNLQMNQNLQGGSSNLNSNTLSQGQSSMNYGLENEMMNLDFSFGETSTENQEDKKQQKLEQQQQQQQQKLEQQPQSQQQQQQQDQQSQQNSQDLESKSSTPLQNEQQKQQQEGMDGGNSGRMQLQQDEKHYFDPNSLEPSLLKKVEYQIGETFGDLDLIMEEFFTTNKICPYTGIPLAFKFQKILTNVNSQEILSGIVATVGNILSALFWFEPNETELIKVISISILSPKECEAYLKKLPQIHLEKKQEQFEQIAFIQPFLNQGSITSKFMLFKNVNKKINQELGYLRKKKPFKTFLSLLNLVTHYRNLYKKPCSNCGQILRLVKDRTLLPPLIRILGSPEVYHDSCYYNTRKSFDFNEREGVLIGNY
ncbi:mediator of RNA polymerase ii transcription subunit 27 [Anaeramoeba flamelloides]|uniref:Mediator of RNA polymerase ii transcription subunit 27 n=1 Tax=Anaeramoeba flamelloides TaxID=1746091 RepID=A0ABQ8Z2W2_9EUKA|nr:mediator of RNA polymerase ii transcription subunit 27 [Anaeramoeba flamelloides]